MAKHVWDARVLSNEKLAEGVYSLRVTKGEEEVRPGQFVGVYLPDQTRLLPRPISICEADAGALRLVYRISGKGTKELSETEPGTKLRILGILGNGYDVEALPEGKVLLLGGGIGAPPLLELAKALHAGGKGVSAVLGYRSDDLFLTEDFSAVCERLIIATDDGSTGYHGNVIEAVRAELKQEFGCICACGPMPMLKGVKALALEWDVPCYLSLEERMACGVGACLGCVAKTREIDAHSHVRNTRICTEGPVFEAREVEL